MAAIRERLGEIRTRIAQREQEINEIVEDETDDRAGHDTEDPGEDLSRRSGLSVSDGAIDERLGETNGEESAHGSTVSRPETDAPPPSGAPYHQSPATSPVVGWAVRTRRSVDE